MAKITFKTRKIQQGLTELLVFKNGLYYDSKINEKKNIAKLKKLYR